MNLVSLFLMLLFLLPVFGQEGESEALNSEDFQERASAPSDSEAPTAYSNEDLAQQAPIPEEQTLERPETEAAPAPETEAAFDANHELKKLGYETIDPSALMDKRVVAIISRLFIENPLRKMPDAEVKKLILEQSKSSFFGDYLQNRPKVLAFFVEVLKDEKAMPQAIGLLKREEDLKLYFFFWLTLMIMTWAIKKFWVKKQKKWDKSKIFLVGLALSLLASVVALTTFYHVFNEELSPTAKILVKHWRRRNL
jgi:hypothetical protein